jgi:hypothetical protein
VPSQLSSIYASVVPCGLYIRSQITPSAQKGHKKPFARGKKHYAQLKSKKEYEKVFFWPFWAEGVICT